MSYINIFGGQTIQPAIVSYLNVTPFITNITLSWASQFQDTNNVVASTMDVNPTVGGLSITMPDATQTSVGQFVTFNNYGSQSVNILDNMGGLITAIAAGNIFYIYLIDNTTVAGTWRTIPFGIGIGTVVTSVGAVSANPTALTITSSTTNPITHTGTFTFTPAADLDALSALAGATGYAVRTGVGTWATRTFVAGTGITLTNAAGIAGNTQIAVNTNLVLSNLTVGNLNLTGNTISSTAGVINIQPLAGQNLTLGNGGAQVTIDPSADITGVNDITGISATFGNINIAGNAIFSTAGIIRVTPFAGQSLTLGSNATPFTIDTTNNVTNVATLTATTLNASNISITGNTISSVAGMINITPLAGQTLKLGSNVSPITITSLNSIFSVHNLTSDGVITAATITATAALTTTFNPSPIAQAWCNYNANTMTLVKGFNVTSVTYVGVGNYTVNFTTPLADGAYSAIVTASIGGGAEALVANSNYALNTNISSNIRVKNLAGVLTDPINVYFAVFD